ncbi:hypothetical protein HELRODRAFT_161355 [Helobdella robusta]|uniref:Uncharacterized protein n=1 Tax=Helobdella robusta TaxID=6412 RepID=T1ERD8_HELRO|nr:hypothetical protein HELRODRAFT_161355 [Helobdella robusta]ESO02118.1 hypothetical protein HELRODRAFT_161355 [Helobdella robusta]
MHQKNQSIVCEFGSRMDCTLNDHIFGKCSATTNCQSLTRGEDSDNPAIISPLHDFTLQDIIQDGAVFRTINAIIIIVIHISIIIVIFVKDFIVILNGLFNFAIFLNIAREPMMESLFPTPPESPNDKMNNMLIPSQQTTRLLNSVGKFHAPEFEECSEVKKLLLSGMPRNNLVSEKIASDRKNENSYKRKRMMNGSRQSCMAGRPSTATSTTSTSSTTSTASTTYTQKPSTRIKVDNSKKNNFLISPAISRTSSSDMISVKDHDYCLIGLSSTSGTYQHSTTNYAANESYRERNPIIASFLLDPNLEKDIMQDTKMLREVSRRKMSVKMSVNSKCHRGTSLNTEVHNDFLTTGLNINDLLSTGFIHDDFLTKHINKQPKSSQSMNDWASDSVPMNLKCFVLNNGVAVGDFCMEFVEGKPPDKAETLNINSIKVEKVSNKMFDEKLNFEFNRKKRKYFE